MSLSSLPSFSSPLVQADADLSRLNTLALPARARFLASVHSVESLRMLMAEPVWGSWPRFILGGGSNVVLARDFEGLVLRVAISGRRLVHEDAEAWYVEAGAGESWHDFVQWTLACGWPGLENLSLIPGTVGAAPIQNIGAYGLEVAERFHALRAINLSDGSTVRLDAAACRFAYRDSLFKQENWHREARLLITEVSFRLPKRWQAVTRYGDVAEVLAQRKIASPGPVDIAEAVMEIRRRKLPDPAALPNAGSFFQNPLVEAAQAARLLADYPKLPQYPQPDGRVKLAAGWLIEQAGWKGRNLGPAGMYEKQALVLVNRGGATGRDIDALTRAVQHDVAARFGVMLVPEPVYLGASSLPA